MPQFQEHIDQAKYNIDFLSKVNELIPNSWDWQVTVSYYAAVHLVNAHLAKLNLQYRSHQDVNHAINPFNPLSFGKLPEAQYASFNKLQNLSRRSRYLVEVKDNRLNNHHAAKTYEKHLAKSSRHLNSLIDFFCDKYGLTFDPISLKCNELKTNELAYIKKG